MSQEKKTVCVDLDGVLASYDGWKGPTVIGEPLSGAVDFVRELAEKFEVVVHTTRANTDEGRAAIEAWLQEHGFTGVSDLVGKPMAVAYVDDRSVRCVPQELLPEFRTKAFSTALKRVQWLALPRPR